MIDSKKVEIRMQDLEKVKNFFYDLRNFLNTAGEYGKAEATKDNGIPLLNGDKYAISIIERADQFVKIASQDNSFKIKVNFPNDPIVPGKRSLWVSLELAGGSFVEMMASMKIKPILNKIVETAISQSE